MRASVNPTAPAGRPIPKTPETRKPRNPEKSMFGTRTFREASALTGRGPHRRLVVRSLLMQRPYQHDGH